MNRTAKGLICLVVVSYVTSLPAYSGVSETGGTDSFARLQYVVNGFKPDVKFRTPTSLAVDQANNLVYVCDSEDKKISAFSLQGVGKFRIGEKGELDDPLGVAVDRRGKLYVSERRLRKIRVFDTGNRLEAEIDLSGIAESPKVQPGKIVVSRSGNLYVVDQANQQILVFDKDRNLKLKFGKIGDRQGEFRTIEDVTVDRQDRIYVADSSGFPVEVFDKSGGYISRIGLRGEANGLVDPVAVTVDRFDQLWVVDSSEHNIRIYDRIGLQLKMFGEYGMGETMLFYPVDMDIDEMGRVYILERGSNRMQVFELESPNQPIPRPR